MEILCSLLTGLCITFLMIVMFKITRIAIRKYLDRLLREIDREIEEDYLSRLQDLGWED